MSNEPIDILKNQPHFNVLALCLEVERCIVTGGTYKMCGHRWIGTVVSKTSLFKLECPKCGAQNSFASFIPHDYLQEFKND